MSDITQRVENTEGSELSDVRRYNYNWKYWSG